MLQKKILVWKSNLEGFEPAWFSRILVPWLNEADAEKKTKKIFANCAVAGMVLALFAFLVAIALLAQPPIFYITWFSLGAFVAPFAFSFLFFAYRFEGQKREKEKRCADVLLAASSLPKGTSAEELLRLMASPNFGLLGNEFARCQSELEAGVSLEEALTHVKWRCHSVAVGRMIDLLVVGVLSGADLSRVFRETAEDLLETQGLLEERQAALVIEKYTILLAGGIVVPLVLGLVWHLILSMDFSLLNQLELGLSAQKRNELLRFSQWGTWAYLVEYGILAGLFVGMQEGHWKKGIVYALVLIPSGLIVFWLASGNGFR